MVGIIIAVLSAFALTPVGVQTYRAVKRHRDELAELGDYPRPPTDEERAEYIRAITQKGACPHARD